MKKISAVVWTILFVLFAYYQRNDPDPMVWILIYGASALIAVLVYMNKIRRPVLWVAFIALIAGALMLWPSSYEGLFLREDGSYTPAIEEARESLGLLIASISMAWHLFVSKAGKAS